MVGRFTAVQRCVVRKYASAYNGDALLASRSPRVGELIGQGHATAS